jgi:hypothetical protein
MAAANQGSNRSGGRSDVTEPFREVSKALGVARKAG